MRRIYQSDLEINAPLPWSLYDDQGNLLLRKGFVLTSQRHIESLLQRGAYVELRIETQPPIRVKTEALSRPSPPSQRVFGTRGKATTSSQIVFGHAKELAKVLGELHAQIQTGVLPYNMVPAIRQLAHQIVDACNTDADTLLAALHMEREAPYLVTQQLLGACLAELVARELKLDDTQRTTLACAALSRDIAILPEQNQLDKQQTPLSDAQQQWIKGHPQRSATLLQHLGVRDKLWLQCVEQHHERIDGSGYPHALKGQEMAMEARLLGITDSYAAMVTPRRNRPSKLIPDALKALFDLRDQQYDARLLQLTIQLLTLYPPGSLVRMANGETAVVRTRRKSGAPLDLWSLYDSAGQPLPTPVARDTRLPQYQITKRLRLEDCRPITHTLPALWLLPSEQAIV